MPEKPPDPEPGFEPPKTHCGSCTTRGAPFAPRMLNTGLVAHKGRKALAPNRCPYLKVQRGGREKGEHGGAERDQMGGRCSPGPAKERLSLQQSLVRCELSRPRTPQKRLIGNCRAPVADEPLSESCQGALWSPLPARVGWGGVQGPPPPAPQRQPARQIKARRNQL